ncbi:MAG: hypothetical protein IJH17_04660 [Clostridia bacterium]|nr:hypothetical protein [Clostridia bacterium]
MIGRKFFDAIGALLPKSRVFDMTAQKNLRSFFEALSVVPDDVKKEFEGVLLDYYPETTRAVDEWEKAFRVQFSTSLFSIQERRNIIGALWLLRYGNTTAEFMQMVLRLFVPGLFVTENVPTANVVGMILNYKNVCGNRYMCCGNRRAFCDEDKYESRSLPQVLRNDSITPWDVPYDERFWNMCFFISGKVTRDETNAIKAFDRIKVNKKWKEFIEYVVLSLKPVQSIAVLFLEYEEDV